MHSGVSESSVRDFFYKASDSYGFVKAKKELLVGGLRIDIFAVNENHDPFIIEFKKKKDRHIVGQAAQYLAIAPSYAKEICEKIDFYKINWDKLSIILIAPEFHDRDFMAATYSPLKGRIHFFTYNANKNSRSEIFSLRLNHVSMGEESPIRINADLKESSDLIDVYDYFYNLKSREGRREYYTNYVTPLLEAVRVRIEDFFSAQGLYFHATYFGNTPPYYLIRLGTSAKQTHRASISLSFYQNSVDHGFDLTHSLQEAKVLSSIFKNQDSRVDFIKKLSEKTDYSLYIPSSGFRLFLPIADLSESALGDVLAKYNPALRKDCYIFIIQNYQRGTLSVEEAAEILIQDYKEFKFIFDALKIAD